MHSPDLSPDQLSKPSEGVPSLDGAARPTPFPTVLDHLMDAVGEPFAHRPGTIGHCRTRELREGGTRAWDAVPDLLDDFQSFYELLEVAKAECDLSLAECEFVEFGLTCFMEGAVLWPGCVAETLRELGQDEGVPVGVDAERVLAIAAALSPLAERALVTALRATWATHLYDAPAESRAETLHRVLHARA